MLKSDIIAVIDNAITSPMSKEDAEVLLSDLIDDLTAKRDAIREDIAIEKGAHDDGQ